MSSSSYLHSFLPYTEALSVHAWKKACYLLGGSTYTIFLESVESNACHLISLPSLTNCRPPLKLRQCSFRYFHGKCSSEVTVCRHFSRGLHTLVYLLQLTIILTKALVQNLTGTLVFPSHILIKSGTAFLCPYSPPFCNLHACMREVSRHLSNRLRSCFGPPFWIPF